MVQGANEDEAEAEADPAIVAIELTTLAPIIEIAESKAAAVAIELEVIAEH